MNKKNIYKLIMLTIGVFLLALNYNIFLLPNNFVIGGTSGLAIVMQNFFGFNPTIFIFMTSIILILLSLLLLGFKETSKTIVGSLLYPLFLALTSPLASKILPYLNIDSILIVVIIAGFFNGIATGIIYKTGFNTGGSDVLMKILNSYFKMPEGESLFIVNLIIMAFGAAAFGINKFIYALIILYINTKVIDRILIGISSSKLFFIYTSKPSEVKKFIIDELKTGVTVLNAHGGFTKKKNDVLMCVVKNRSYYLFKEKVLEIDPKAFFVIDDCYEVAGGVKGKNYPFI